MELQDPGDTFLLQDGTAAPIVESGNYSAYLTGVMVTSATRAHKVLADLEGRAHKEPFLLSLKRGGPERACPGEWKRMILPYHLVTSAVTTRIYPANA